jgi:hypothetical protein
VLNSKNWIFKGKSLDNQIFQFSGQSLRVHNSGKPNFVGEKEKKSGVVSTLKHHTMSTNL